MNISLGISFSHGKGAGPFFYPRKCEVSIEPEGLHLVQTALAPTDTEAPPPITQEQTNLNLKGETL